MSINPLTDSLKSRKSVRAFEDRQIPEDIKQEILRCAAQAPTAGNQQLYTILDITDQALKEKLAVTCLMSSGICLSSKARTDFLLFRLS